MLLALTLLLLSPTAVLACESLLLGELLCFSERTQIREAAYTERTRIENAQKERSEQIKQDAAAEIRRVEADRAKAVAEGRVAETVARAQADTQIAAIEQMALSKIAEIQAGRDEQVASIAALSSVGIAGITQTAQTERTRIVSNAAIAVCLVALFGSVLFTRRRQFLPQPRPNFHVQRSALPMQKGAEIEHEIVYDAREL